MSASTALSARDVAHFAPAGDVLLHHTSFELEDGAILAIAGPNGAGKTTLLNLLSGACDLSVGEVWIGGRNLAQMSVADRARLIAVVGQQELPDGRLRLRDYVALGQIPIYSDRSNVDHSCDLTRILQETGLDHLADHKMGVLSGGERQRAHIARALAQRPSVLFLDEPTNHLDPDAKGRILSLVSELGITVVMIVHDLVLIPEFATHVALMNAARVTGFGPVTTVLTPDTVRATFGVDYLCFQHEGRMVPALDIRKSTPFSQMRNALT